MALRDFLNRIREGSSRNPMAGPLPAGPLSLANPGINLLRNYSVQNQTRQLPNNGGSYQAPTVAPMQGPAPTNWGSPSLNNMYTGTRPPTPPTNVSRPPAPPTQTQPTGTGIQSPVSAEDKAYYINAIRESRGDIGNFAANAYANPNPSATDARINYGNIENTQMDVATGELDPYEIGSRSGISYSPEELGAIEKAMAGVYDPAIESAKATYERALRMEESEREHAQDMELQSAKAVGSGSGVGGVSTSSVDGSTGLDGLKISNTAKEWVIAINRNEATLDDIKGTSKQAQALRDEIRIGLNATRDQSKSTTNRLDLIGQLDELLYNKKLGKISGFFGALAGGIGGEARNAKTAYQNIAAKLQLEAAALLKGQGQVSNFERDILEQASMDMSRFKDDESFREALVKMKAGLQLANGMETKVTIYPKPGEKDPDTGLLMQPVTYLANRDTINQARLDGRRVVVVE